METCPHCHDLEKLLTKAGITYKTIDVDVHVDLFDTVCEETGAIHVPQILINEWDGKEFTNNKFISEFDTLDEVVEKVKNIL